MSTNAAHKHWWQTFEVVCGIPFLIAIVLQFVVPRSLYPEGLTPVMIVCGAALIGVGAAFVVLARREFARYGQPTDPGRATHRVVTTGVFAVSRNPLYLGGVCMLVGIGVAANLAWVLVLLVPSLVACHYVLITPEERYLAARFGAEYQAYAASVRRWLGRARRRGR